MMCHVLHVHSLKNCMTTVNGCGLEDKDLICGRKRIFHFVTTFKAAVVPMQCKADNSPPSNTKVNNTWNTLHSQLRVLYVVLYVTFWRQIFFFFQILAQPEFQM